MGVVVVHGCRAQRVGNKVNCFMIVLNARIPRKNRRVVRVFDVLFKPDRIGAGKTDQFKQKAQQIAVVVRLPSWPFEHLAHVFERVFHGGQIVRNKKGPNGRAADHDHFKWQSRQDRAQLSASQHIAAEHHDHDYNNANCAKHT